MKNNFRVKVKQSSNYWVRYIFRYRHADNGSVFTTCLLFLYSPESPLPENLDLQTAHGAGFAKCVPQDQFSKAIGRRLTLARALKDAGVPIEERIQIWHNYHEGKYTV